MTKKNYPMNSCRRRCYIETENNALWSIQGSNNYTQKKILQQKTTRSHNTISGEECRDLTKQTVREHVKVVTEVSRRSNCFEIVQKDGAVVSQRKERTRWVYKVGCPKMIIEQKGEGSCGKVCQEGC